MQKNCLQEIMYDKHISYQRLSRKTGISVGQLYNIANCISDPTQTTMIAIARGLKMQVTDIFNLKY